MDKIAASHMKAIIETLDRTSQSMKDALAKAEENPEIESGPYFPRIVIMKLAIDVGTYSGMQAERDRIKRELPTLIGERHFGV